MGKHFIGIDIGTTNIKAVLFDENFKQVFSASRNNETFVKSETRHEQDMNAIMDKTIETLAQIVSQSGVSTKDIQAIGLSGQGEGVWLVDEDGKPVQNSIIWSDIRSSEIVANLSNETKEQLVHITGSEPVPCNQTLILSWLAQNDPEVLDKARYCLFSKDWVRFGLTGKIAVDMSDAGTSIMDLASRKVSEEAFERLGITQYLRLIPEILPSNQCVGAITETIADLTGLNKETLVVMGGLDVSCTALGLGASGEGDVFSILGTTCCTGIVTEDGTKRSFGARCIPHTYPQKYIELIATLSGTPNIDWALDNVSDTKDFQVVEKKIADVSIGSGGIWYHPYIGGERAPFFNANARASFFGINRGTTRAHLLRAARNIPQSYMALKTGNYVDNSGVVTEGIQKDAIWDITAESPYSVFKGVELHNKVLGIIGYGSIGRRVGRIARAFGMSLKIYDPWLAEVDINEPGVQLTTIEDLLSNADFVTLHLKVTKETIGFLSRERIAMMKSTAILVNTSRAAVLDEEAVIAALREGRLRAGGFDVFAHEPIHANHPYISELDNVSITPHIAGATIEVLTNHTNMIVSEIKRFTNGQPLLMQYK